MTGGEWEIVLAPFIVLRPPQMSIAEIEERLHQEEQYLAEVIHTGNEIAIALARVHVADWSRRLQAAREDDEGRQHDRR